MEQSKNANSPDSAPAAGDSPGSGLFYRDGREIPPTHPDHGPMHLLPRQENGGFAAYYYCSKAELYDAEIPGPPPRRYRRDGFGPDRQEAFLEAVRGGASGREAARKIGISPTTAYNLYNSPDGGAFRAAWDEAARVTDIVLEDTAFDRAVNGQEEIVYHKGRRVGVRWKYDNNLLLRLMRARMPLKYAPLSEIEGWLKRRGIAPPPDVDGALDRLRAAEAEWGRRLPGEESPAALEAPEPQAALPGTDEVAAASTSSTSPGNGQSEEAAAESMSSTSSEDGHQAPASSSPAAEAPGPSRAERCAASWASDRGPA